MINGIVGLPGHGKSLEGVRRACEAHDRGDTHVYANLPLALERFTLVTPETLALVRAGACPCKCKRVFVLLDEVHLWLPARRSLQLPISWLELFSQTRKLGWDLWWTAQNEMRVDRMLRDVTGWMYLATGWVWPVQFFVYEKFEPEHFRKAGRRISKDVRRRSRRASAAYDTGGQIVRATHVQDKNDPYALAVQGDGNTDG